MKKRILTSGVVASILLFLIVGTFVFVKGQKRNQIELTSDVEKVSVISRRHEAAISDLGVAVYQMKNEAEVPIVAITFETDDRQSRFHRIATIAPNNEKQIVALGQAMFEIRVPLDPGISYNHIVAVVYADGTVSGRPDATSYLKQLWEESYKEAGERLQ